MDGLTLQGWGPSGAPEGARSTACSLGFTSEVLRLGVWSQGVGLAAWIHRRLARPATLVAVPPSSCPLLPCGHLLCPIFEMQVTHFTKTGGRGDVIPQALQRVLGCCVTSAQNVGKPQFLRPTCISLGYFMICGPELENCQVFGWSNTVCVGRHHTLVLVRRWILVKVLV